MVKASRSDEAPPADEFELVRGLIKIGDLEALKKFTPTNFDCCAPHPETKVPSLHFAIVCGISREPRFATNLQIVQWMVKSGADPSQKAPQNCGNCFTLFSQDAQGKSDPATKVSVSYKGHSAVSLILAWIEALQGKSHRNVLKYFEGVLSTITTAAEAQRPKVTVDQSLLDRWEGVFDMVSTHNVTFQTQDGPVTAHDHLLMAASPVLRAMLESGMTEGANKCIQVQDSPRSGVSLFLEILYTSSTRVDPNHQMMLGALDLAHRWQVMGVVRVLADALREVLSPQNFAEIAQAAVLKDLSTLKGACTTFGLNSPEVKAQLTRGKLPKEVHKLLDRTMPSSDDSKKKKRRTF